MVAWVTFDELELSNRCVVVCNLELWDGADTLSWGLLTGEQAEIGVTLAQVLADHRVERIEDFGGVCETFLCDSDGTYRADPPPIRGSAAIFSFTPKNRIVGEGAEMARVGAASGYRLLIMTVQKTKKYGKVWTLSAALEHHTGSNLEYFEDTNTVIDELKASPGGDRVVAIHVQTPGYEEYRSQLADRIVTQEAYRAEVLA